MRYPVRIGGPQTVVASPSRAVRRYPRRGSVRFDGGGGKAPQQRGCALSAAGEDVHRAIDTFRGESEDPAPDRRGVHPRQGPVRRRSACGELFGRERSKHTELVAVWVGHHHPTGVIALADVDAPGTEPFKPKDLSSLIEGSQVKVQAILSQLLLGFIR